MQLRGRRLTAWLISGRRSADSLVLMPRYPASKNVRYYAKPASFDIPTKVAYRPPPAPDVPQLSSDAVYGRDQVQDAEGAFDEFLKRLVHSLNTPSAVSVNTLYSQYRGRAARILDLVLPYEEKPNRQRRADCNVERIDTDAADGQVGDGVVMVVHALLKANGKVDKICTCSGFAVNAEPNSPQSSRHDVIVTCAHTLEEMHRNITSNATGTKQSFSFVIPNDGQPRRVRQILSSMPRSDVVVMELEAADPASNPSRSPKILRTLPLSPYSVSTGAVLLTHLFSGSSQPPQIQLSRCRLPKDSKQLAEQELQRTQEATPWLQGKASRRLAVGVMLGYRSYTGVEVEAGIHSSLPHILTSVLPTPGSSGGPLICGETGAVVGMISGRRMDNRIEGERGWGSSAESIFEMFSLPGFTPTNRK